MDQREQRGSNEPREACYMHTCPRALRSPHTPWLLFYIFLARRLGNSWV